MTQSPPFDDELPRGLFDGLSWRALATLAHRAASRALPIAEIRSESWAPREALAFLAHVLREESAAMEEVESRLSGVRSLSTALKTEATFGERLAVNRAEYAAVQAVAQALGVIRAAHAAPGAAGATAGDLCQDANICAVMALQSYLDAYDELRAESDSRALREDLARVLGAFDLVPDDRAGGDLALLRRAAALLAEDARRVVDESGRPDPRYDRVLKMLVAPDRVRSFTEKTLAAEFAPPEDAYEFSVGLGPFLNPENIRSIWPCLIPRNLTGLIALLFELEKCGYSWLRGEARDFGKTALTPTSLRSDKVANEPAELIRKLEQRVDPAYLQNPLVRIALRQHYGEPTRLLDWTENKLAATFFAMGEEDALKESGFLFCLNPARLRQAATLPGFDDSANVLLRSAFPPAAASPSGLDEVADVIANARPNSGLLGLVRRMIRGERHAPLPAYTSQPVRSHLSQAGLPKKVAAPLQFALLGLPYPLTVKKNFPRIETQTGSFTIHSGFHGHMPHPVNLRLLSQWLSGEEHAKEYALAKLLLGVTSVLQDLLVLVEVPPAIKEEFAKRWKLDEMSRTFYPSDDEWLEPSRPRTPLGGLAPYRITMERDIDAEGWTFTVRESGPESDP